MATEGASVPPVTGALADALTERFEGASERLMAKRHSAVDALVTGWLEAHEADLASMVRPHIEPHLHNVDYPDNVRDLFRILAAPEHQTQFFTALFAIQGIITQFVSAAVAPYVNDVSQAAWNHDASLALSPDAAADAVLKGWWSHDVAQAEARLSGIGTERFGVMVDLAGEPPGIEGMLGLWRRGDLTTEQLDHAIRESRIRDEWVEAVHLLALIVPTTMEVLAGYVQGHLSEADARTKWAQAGGKPENFEWQYASAGRPPGPEQMLHLWNRGKVTEAEVEAAIRESDVKDKYIPAIKALRVYLPPPRSIVAMIRQGAISDDEARTFLTDAGVDAHIQDVFIKSGHATRASAHKELSVAKAITGYEEHTLTRTQAQTIITSSGYNATQAGELLDISDATIVHREQQAIISHAHSLYTRYRMNRADASSALDTAQVPSAQRDRLLTLWNLERKENAPQLTHAQITGAWRRSLITTEDATAHLEALGYTAEASRLLLAEAIPPTKYPYPKDIPGLGSKLHGA